MEKAEKYCGFIIRLEVESDIKMFNKIVCNDNDFEFIEMYYTKQQLINNSDVNVITNSNRAWILPGTWNRIYCGKENQENINKFNKLHDRIIYNKYNYKFIIYKDPESSYTFGADLVENKD